MKKRNLSFNIIILIGSFTVWSAIVHAQAFIPTGSISTFRGLKAEITNLQLAVKDFLITIDQSSIAAPVVETDQGATDLNLDLDTVDTVIHYHDDLSGQTINIQTALHIAFGPGIKLQVKNDKIVFLINEAEDGNQDLNGDGDTLDNVLALYDIPSGILTKALGNLAVSDFYYDGNTIAFCVPEKDQGPGGTDINGDGDKTDFIHHAFLLDTGFVVNFLLANTSASLFPDKVIENESMVILIHEDFSSLDLNFDGDSKDTVIAIFDPETSSFKILSLAVISDFIFGSDGNHLSFVVSESDQHADLNGDGDQSDNIIHVYDKPNDTIINLGLATSYPQALLQGDPLNAAFTVNEAQQGSVDLNGDGDIQDDVIHNYSYSTGQIKNLGMGVVNGLDQVAVDGEFTAFLVSENAQGQTDLNGDGDALDWVVHVYGTISNRVTNLKLAAEPSSLRLKGNVLGIGVLEPSQADTDLNGDGDKIDTVLHIAYLNSTIDVQNLGLANKLPPFNYYPPIIDGPIVGFVAVESAQGNTDLNGDGDASDFVLHLYNAKTHQIVNQKLAVSPFFQIEENLMSFAIWELRQNNMDFNADGDALDFVLQKAKLSF